MESGTTPRRLLPEHPFGRRKAGAPARAERTESQAVGQGPTPGRQGRQAMHKYLSGNAPAIERPTTEDE